MGPSWVFIWFRGCKGLQPSRVGNVYWSFDQDLDLEGVRSLGAALDDRGFVAVGKRLGVQR